MRGQITSHPLDKDGWSDEDNQETRHVPNFSSFQYNNANQFPPVPFGGITNQIKPLPNYASSTTLNQENQLLKAKLAHGVERALAQRTPPPSAKEVSTWEIDVDISGADWP